MKNIKLSTRLVLAGLIILLIPLAVMGFVAIQQASKGLTAEARGELTKRTEEISHSIYNNLMKEEKLLLSISVRADVISSLSGEMSFDGINADLHRLKATKDLGEDYQIIGIIDLNGITRAATSDDYIGLDISDREYLKEALKGTPNIGQAALNKITGKPFIPFAAPVYGDGGKVIGAAISILDLDFLWELIKDSTIGKTGYTYVTDANGLFIAHPDSALLFETSIRELEGMEVVTRRFFNGENGYEHYVYRGEPKTTGFAVVEKTGWGVFMAQPDEEFLESTYIIRKMVLIVAVASFLITFVVFIMFSRSITNPIKKIVNFAEKISEGILYTEVDINQKDEIGQLAGSLSNMQRKLSEVVSNVIDSSIQVSSGSNQLSQSAEQLSSGATEQASNAEEVSSSVEQMGANIQQNTDNAAKTEDIASQAAVDMENGGIAVLEAVEAMNQIAQKIDIIEDIARQTNMLSLNAAIEAARAGEHGKGFAVVASEVGKLAAVSQKAAAEIQELAKESVDKANKAGGQIQSVVPDIRKTAELITEISASSHEQNAGAEQINTAMIQLDQVIQQNAAASEEVSSMSEELSSQADMLMQLVSFFKLSPDTTVSYAGIHKEIEKNEKEPGGFSEKKSRLNMTLPAKLNKDAVDNSFVEF